MGETGFDHKLRGEIGIFFGCYLEKIVRGILLVTTKKVHWGLKRRIIDFEESLTEARWGAKKMNAIRDYMLEVIINVTKRTP